MSLSILQEQAVELGRQLFNSSDKILPRAHIKSHLGLELEEFMEIVRAGLVACSKFEQNKGRVGGVKFKNAPRQRSTLSKNDEIDIKEGVKKEWNKYQEAIKKIERDKPEKEVEDAFKKWWAENEEPKGSYKFTRFRSSARGASKWENVDGYAIRTECYKYHILFRPILTTFEIKGKIPDIRDFNQAKNYKNFSHEVYVVFKFEGDADALRGALSKVGFDYRQEGMGIYFTRDGVEFVRLEEARRGYPTEDKVDEKLEKLLSEDDQTELLDLKYKYLVNEVLIPSISN